jgi:carbonic anhydrase
MPQSDAMSRAMLLRAVAATGLTAAGNANAFAAAPANTPVAPGEALRRLVAGNARFVSGRLTQRNEVTERRLALTGHQAPFAAILSCSDSRVPPELVFDQNVGDLFVYRNAGNFVQPAVLGTMEYGYSALGTRLIVVLGHEACGAVKATYDAIADQKPLPPNLNVIEDAIAPGIRSEVSAKAGMHRAVEANAKAQAARFADSPVLGPAITRGELRVVAADYDFVSGKVTILT